MHGDAGRVGGRRGASVVAGVRRLGFRYQQPAGPGLFFRDHADTTTTRVVDNVSITVPINEAGRVRRLQDHARQVYVAPAADVHFRVADYLGLRYCEQEKPNQHV